MAGSLQSEDPAGHRGRDGGLGGPFLGPAVILQRQLDVGMALLWVHDPPFEGLEKALNPWFTSWERK